MDPSRDLSTDLQAETARIIHYTILDQISETIAVTQAAMKTTITDKPTTGTTIETEGTNKTHGMTKEIIAFRTGILQKEAFVQGMISCIEKTKVHCVGSQLDPSERWDYIKFECLQFAKNFSKQVASSRKELTHNLNRLYNELQYKILECTQVESIQGEETLKQVQHKINTLEEEKVRGPYTGHDASEIN